MSYGRDEQERGQGRRNQSHSNDRDGGGGGRYRDEVYSKRVPAGKRTYCFDVKTTRSGRDFFITITESKRVDEESYEKHKIFLYKEDFGKFVRAIHEVIGHIQEECLPDYEFRDLPEISNHSEEPSYMDDDDY